MMRHPTVREILLVLAASGLAVLLRLALDPMLGDMIPFTTGYAAVALTALLGGWRAAAATTLVTLVALSYLFIARGDLLSLVHYHDLIVSLAYIGMCAIIISVVGSMRVAQARARAVALEARRVQREATALAGRMTLLTDALPVLISYVDAQSRYQFNNRGYEEWFGHTRGETRGRHLREVLGDVVYERVRPHVEAALAGRPAHFEEELPYQSGGTRTVQADYIPDRREDGTVAGFYVLVSDISERRRVEAAARESEKRFRALADSSPAMIWVHGQRGSQAREFVNREYLRFLGAQAEQVEGSGWKTYVHPDDLPGYVAVFDDAVHRRVPFDQEARTRRFDGEWRWVRTVARPRFSASGEYLGHAGLALDVTDLHLAQRRIMESERLAAVGHLAAGLAHDMSNLIMPLGEALSELKGVALAEEPRAALALAERCTLALRDLARSMRGLVRTDGVGQGPQRIDLREWWARTGPLLAASIPRRVRLSAEFGEAPLLITAVEGDLTRAMLNLLVNAAEAMGEACTREPTIRVCGRLLEGAEFVELSVTDNGPGIPPALRERIFEPFFSTKKGLSTGMGISIIQEFVHACGGALTLESEEGRGTTFTMKLPAVASEPPDS